MSQTVVYFFASGLKKPHKRADLFKFQVMKPSIFFSFHLYRLYYTVDILSAYMCIIDKETLI